jgi:hypothetical protein
MYVMRNYTTVLTMKHAYVCLLLLVDVMMMLGSKSLRLQPQIAAVLRSALTPGLVALYPVDAGLRLEA